MSAKPSKTATTASSKTPPRATSKKRELLGEIRADSIYAIETFKQRISVGTWGFRQMRRAGLRICRSGGRGFVIGADFLEFLAQRAEDPP